MRTMLKSAWNDFFDRDTTMAGLPRRRDCRPQKRAGLLRGSGNVYRDLGHPNADVKKLKALLAAEILKTLDRQQLSVRQAQMRTGIVAADFSRIRNANLGRFTLDRLMSIINRLGSRVEVKLKVRPVGIVAHATTS